MTCIFASSIMRRTITRRIWCNERSSQFWENDMAKSGGQKFKEDLRISIEAFNLLCDFLRGMERKDTNYRKCIPLEKRIAIALYSLGSSSEYRSVANIFGVGRTTVGEIVLEFCELVWNKLAPIYLNFYPLTEETVETNILGFEIMGFPQCIGALDGCHIEVAPCKEDATEYFNYKGWYSTVLLALVNHRYEFMYINVGAPGWCHVSSIYEKSILKKYHARAEILQRYKKSINNVDVPVVIIADSAFRLSENVMKPYPFAIDMPEAKKNFNRKLSKCRRVVENAFGHLKARFRRLGKGLENDVTNANKIIKACCVLHNFLSKENDPLRQSWLDEELTLRSREQPSRTTITGNSNPTAQMIRETIGQYLVPELDDDDRADGIDSGDEVLL